MRMEQLEYLINLAETGSITQTAKCFFMSQQGISYSIQQLEKELNVKILSHHKNRVAFTPAGERILHKAKVFIKIYKEMQEELEPFQKDTAVCHKTNLSLYVDPIMAGSFLPKIIKKLHKHTKIKLIAQEKNKSDLVQILSEPSEDDKIGLVNLTEHYFTDQFKENLVFQPIYTSHLLALVAEMSPLSKYKTLSIENLLQYPISALNDDPNNCTIHDSLFDGYTDTRPNIILQTTNIDFFHETIKKNMAVGMTSGFLESFYNPAGLKAIPIKEDINFYIGFLRRKEQPFSIAAEEFISIVKELLHRQLSKSDLYTKYEVKPEGLSGRGITLQT